MAWTVTTLGASPRRIKFKVASDGVDLNVIIDNATLVAALRGPSSAFKDVLTATYASKAAAEAAITDQFEFDLWASPTGIAGADPRATGVEIDIDKGGLPTIIVSHSGTARANWFAYVYLDARHSIIG
jgi:hypothetical protein